MNVRTWIAMMLLALPLAASAGERVRLDEASAEQLAGIDGVSPEIAAAIVDLRSARGGRLVSVEELRVIPGVSSDTLDALRRATEIPIELPIERGRPYASSDEVLGEFANEPGIQQVQAWANEYAKTSPDLVRKWLAQSRTFAVLPEVDLEYRLRSGYDLDWQYYPNDGVVDTPDEQVFDVLDDAGEDKDAYYTVRATWKLDELIMSSERIRVLNEVQDIVKLRDKVLSEATRLYFERRRLQAEMLLAPKPDVRGQVIDQLRLMEMTANLDALTGGQFSAHLK